MSVKQGVLPTEVPEWLPAALTGTWNFLAAYPPALALVVLVVGLAIAIIGRLFVLHWGGKLTSGVDWGLDTRLLRISANVAALILAYFAAVLAVQVLGLSDRV